MRTLSLAVASLLASQIAVADEVKKNDWSLEGNIRTAFISDTNDKKGSEETHDLAVSGSITLLAPKVKGFTVGATLYTTQPLFGQQTNNFLTETDGGSYSYLGEAYITGAVFGKTSVILGRKIIDTPFADSDDIGMTPNSFEVYLVQNNDIENITFTAGRVTKWAGVDAPTRGKFTNITDGDGVSVTAVNYADKDLGIEAQAWYYNLDNFTSQTDSYYFNETTKLYENKVTNSSTSDIGIAYIDGAYSLELDKQSSVVLSAQFVQFLQLNGAKQDGSAIGVQAEYTFDALNVAVAYNQADGDIAPTNGFGGGPFYASADILTIADSGQDSTAWRVSGSYDIDKKTSISLGYAGLTPKNGSDLSEIDVSASYAYNDNFSLDLYIESWTTQQDSKTQAEKKGFYSNKTDSNFEYSIFANYSF